MKRTVDFDALVLWEIRRDQVEAGIEGARAAATRLKEIGPSNCISLSFGGYDDDPRELWEIDEVRAFLQWMIIADPKTFFSLNLTTIDADARDFAQEFYVSVAFELIHKNNWCVEVAQAVRSLILREPWPLEDAWAKSMESTLTKMVDLIRQQLFVTMWA